MKNFYIPKLKRSMNCFAFSLIYISLLATTTSCAFIKNNLDSIASAGKTGAIVIKSEDLANELIAYIGADKKASDLLLADDGPMAYALDVAEFFKGNLEVPILEILEEYPDTNLKTLNRK